jgi:hypothetical protein
VVDVSTHQLLELVCSSLRWLGGGGRKGGSSTHTLPLCCISHPSAVVCLLVDDGGAYWLLGAGRTRQDHQPQPCPPLHCARSSGQEALLACSSTDLESGTAGLFRLHYLLLPCPASCDQPAALLAKRVASAEELLAPVLQASNGMALQGAAALSPAVAEAVASQLALVPLEQLDPLALSSRSNETVEVRCGV